MGDYDLARFSDELKMNLGDRAALSSPLNWYTRLINSAYLQLCTRDRLFSIKRRIFIPEIEVSSAVTTIDGTAYVSIPSTCYVVRGVWNSTDDAMLTWISPEEYWDRTGRASTSSEGQPTEYTRRGTYLYLYPTPDDSTTSLTIYFKRRPTDLVQDTDKTIIDKTWDDIIVNLATVNAGYRLHEYDFADAEKKKFIEDAEGVISSIYDERIAANQFIFPDVGRV